MPEADHAATKWGHQEDKDETAQPGASTGAAFASIRVCSANIPRYSQAASVGRVKVPFKLASKIDKIALLADTGCRIKVSRSQNCSSPTDWPLATVAKSIAATKPDLAMMLGTSSIERSAAQTAP